jgi:hypothetical protein
MRQPASIRRAIRVRTAQSAARKRRLPAASRPNHAGHFSASPGVSRRLQAAPTQIYAAFSFPVRGVLFFFTRGFLSLYRAFFSLQTRALFLSRPPRLLSKLDLLFIQTPAPLHSNTRSFPFPPPAPSFQTRSPLHSNSSSSSFKHAFFFSPAPRAFFSNSRSSSSKVTVVFVQSHSRLHPKSQSSSSKITVVFIQTRAPLHPKSQSSSSKVTVVFIQNHSRLHPKSQSSSFKLALLFIQTRTPLPSNSCSPSFKLAFSSPPALSVPAFSTPRAAGVPPFPVYIPCISRACYVLQNSNKTTKKHLSKAEKCNRNGYPFSCYTWTRRRYHP